MTNVHGVVILGAVAFTFVYTVSDPAELLGVVREGWGGWMRSYIKPIKAWRKQTQREREKHRLLWTLSFTQRLCGYIK